MCTPKDSGWTRQLPLTRFRLWLCGSQMVALNFQTQVKGAYVASKSMLGHHSTHILLGPSVRCGGRST